jgi:uncharacterized protein
MTDLQQDTIREFVIAAHGDLNKVRAMLEQQPDLLRVEWDWGPGGREDGLGAASHVGNREIAEFFLARGVPLTICAAAMLGRFEEVQAFVAADPAQANARGAHGITLMFHTALGGRTDIAQFLKDSGCTEGYSHALHGAIINRHTSMVAWLLANGATDPNVQDWQGKTPLTAANEHGLTEIADLLKAYGAV